MRKKDENADIVQSPIGKQPLDTEGRTVSAVRMDPDEGYGAIPLLLKEYIDNSSEKAWEEIRRRIDNIYAAVSVALEILDKEEPFSNSIGIQLERGKKLLFKPNLISLPIIDPQTHGPGLIGTCTPWEFIAVIMRWFHDKRGVSYHQMAIGEAGTETPRIALAASKIFGNHRVTSQALMEGKIGNHFGGWGFYFARKYLADCHNQNHTDDPMQGYEESLTGVCLMPGNVNDKLLIYDLNQIDDDYFNGRDIPVKDGINFKSVTLHKAVIGGNPLDAEDIRNWPGCVLVNVPKLKIHAIDLFTCAIKNLGIGLFPLQANAIREPGKIHWKYAIPDWQVPIVKMGLPHQKWVVKYDGKTGAPSRDVDGEYIYKETGGLQATMADLVQAVKGQGITMLHVVDAIEATNITHAGRGCAMVPEGLIFAGTDVVAVDACASRYLYNMVSLAEADKTRKDYKLASNLIQRVPVPKLRGTNIETGEGFDSPLSRHQVLRHCEERGIGQQKFHVVGEDIWHIGTLASLKGQLGRVENETFHELLTTILYHVPRNLLWNLQTTAMAYLELNDKITGSDFKNDVLKAFDENGDGVIDFMERGKGNLNHWMALEIGVMTQDIDPLEALKLRFLLATTPLKLLKPHWNKEGHGIGDSGMLASALFKAYDMSKASGEKPDPLFPQMSWGEGKWPSLQYAMQQLLLSRVFGQKYPEQIAPESPFGCAFRYADATCNNNGYCEPQNSSPDEKVIDKYFQKVKTGGKELPFTFYMPAGVSAEGIINIEETDNPKIVFTVNFNNEECWQDLNLLDYKLK